MVLVSSAAKSKVSQAEGVHSPPSSSNLHQITNQGIPGGGTLGHDRAGCGEHGETGCGGSEGAAAVSEAGPCPGFVEGRNIMTNEEGRAPYVGDDGDRGVGEEPRGAGGSRHRWMMIACCIPMLIVAVALIASGTVGIGSLVFALACLGMMAVMMFSMGGQRH